ncbi:MAG TPA: alpha/beta fold hydrolase, partial [Thermomicrobiales bacterium]|nr:alpha/beta fold hydrolase [Thermomicrobiales bacterium]
MTEMILHESRETTLIRPLTIPVFREQGVVGRERGARAFPVVREDVGAGPPLVLVHGLSASSRWWQRNIPALAREHHVYAIELPGFGANRSRPLSRRQATFVLRDASRQLATWMDEAGIERASVVGHSMGGYIAADLA